jgi:hypothetical protein
VTQSRWLGISVGTLIVAMATWFGVLAVRSDTDARSNLILGLLIFGVGLAFAMYSVAGFSRADDPMETGFIAAIFALVTATALAIFAQAVGVGAVLILSPVVAIGIGGARALAPTRDKSRNLARLAATAVVVLVMYFVSTVEISAYWLIAPLVPLPALGIADRLYDRGREVVEEEV